MIDPHHRAAAAVAAAKSGGVPKDVKTREILAVIQGKSTNTDLCYAWRKFTSDKARAILDSYMLAGADYDEVRRATDIPIPALMAYGEYLFDASVFLDRLDRVEYVESVENYIDPASARYLRAAITSGPEYITWLLTGTSHHQPKDVLHHTMVDSMFRGQEHRGASVTSDVACKAQQWAKLAQKSASDLQRLDPQDDQDALQELRLALEYEDDTINQHTLGAPKPEDILH